MKNFGDSIQKKKEVAEKKNRIFKSSMSEYVPLFSEYYKVKFLYKALVFQKTHEQYSNGNDEIELFKGIIIDEESTEIFLTKNQR